jgi:hypothetical protein
MKTNDNGVNRDMTDDEIESYNNFLETKSKEIKAEAKALVVKNAAKQAVLDKLGLTAEEIAALLS